MAARKDTPIIRRGDLDGRPWVGWGVLPVHLAQIMEQGQAPIPGGRP